MGNQFSEQYTVGPHSTSADFCRLLSLQQDLAVVEVVKSKWRQIREAVEEAAAIDGALIFGLKNLDEWEGLLHDDLGLRDNLRLQKGQIKKFLIKSGATQLDKDLDTGPQLGPFELPLHEWMCMGSCELMSDPVKLDSAERNNYSREFLIGWFSTKTSQGGQPPQPDGHPPVFVHPITKEPLPVDPETGYPKVIPNPVLKNKIQKWSEKFGKHWGVARVEGSKEPFYPDTVYVYCRQCHHPGVVFFTESKFCQTRLHGLPHPPFRDRLCSERRPSSWWAKVLSFRACRCFGSCSSF